MSLVFLNRELYNSQPKDLFSTIAIVNAAAIALRYHSFKNADLFLKVPGSMPVLLYELLTSFNSKFVDAL